MHVEKSCLVLVRRCVALLALALASNSYLLQMFISWSNKAQLVKTEPSEIYVIDVLKLLLVNSLGFGLHQISCFLVECMNKLNGASDFVLLFYTFN